MDHKPREAGHNRSQLAQHEANMLRLSQLMLLQHELVSVVVGSPEWATAITRAAELAVSAEIRRMQEVVGA